MAMSKSAAMGRAAANRRRHLIRDLVRKHRGLCALCGRPVDFKAESPFYATIDHIRPLSKGGSELPANMQLACLACNASKADAWDGREGA